jgi:VWFA-related protein
VAIGKRVSFAVLAAALFGPAASIPSSPSAAAGQEILIRPQKPLTHEVSVVLKLIQAYVTDKKGNPVSDLKKEDFVLTDGGRTVTITEFERHILSPPPGDAAAPKPRAPAQARGVDAALSASPAAAPSISRKFVLFFDFAYNNARGIKKGKEAALHFIDRQIEAGDEVALFSYSTLRGLSVNEFLTADHKKVRAAVEALDVKRIAGRAEDVEQEYWLQATGQIEPRSGEPNDVPWRRMDSKKQAENYIIKLTALAKGLRYVPGQKHLILFSTGIANSLIYGANVGTTREDAPKSGPTNTSFAQQASANEVGDRVLIQRYEEFFKELSSSNCAVFSFDTRAGPMAPTLFIVDEATFGDGKLSRDMFTTSGVRQNQSSIFKEDKLTGLYSLTRLSKDTGGKYYGNIDEYERNLDQVRTLTGTYYVLGYPISQAWDGAFHEIRVEVKRKGCEVRAQSGYFNPRPFSAYSDLEKELHLLDLALSENPVFQTPAVGMMAVLAADSEDPGTNLVLLTLLPPNAVEKLGGGKSELVTLIFDEAGKLADLRRTEADLSKHRDQSVYYASGTALPPGSYQCRFVARNLETGEAAVATAKTFVAKPLEQGIRLHAPLLLVPGTNASYLEGRLKRTSQARTAPRHSWTSLYPFDDASEVPLLGPPLLGTTRVRAVVPCTICGLDAYRLAFKAVFVNSATGERTEPRVTPEDQVAANGAVIQTLALSVEGLAPGNYLLYLYAEETVSKSLSYSTAPLTIR